MYKNKRRILTFMISLLLTGILTVSCSSLPHSRDYVYASQTEAIADFRDFQSELSSMSSADKEDLSAVLVQWREMRDSVFSYVIKDTLKAHRPSGRREFFQIDDSIARQMNSLVDCGKFTLSDVLYVKEHASPLTSDKDLISARDRANDFFTSLDSIGLMKKVSRQILLRDYRRFLQRTVLAGFNDRNGFLSFLRSEDIYFRMFLLHLPEYGNDPVRDITKFSEMACEKIRKTPSLDSETKVVYMAMRTNRRLVQNMQTCMDDIKHLRCNTELMANSYYCMIVQPFVTLDDVSVALLTADQKHALYETAENVNATLVRTKVSKELLDMLGDKLPKQLLKVYISTINN